MNEPTTPQVILVAENASARFGGEAVLPLHYFKRLKAKNIDVRLIVHARVRDELEREVGDALGNIVFITDTRMQRWLHKLATLVPARVAELTLFWLISIITSIRQRSAVKAMIRGGFGDVVHQPIPVSPKLPSFLYGLSRPVIIGPMNGGMEFPPAFRARESRVAQALVQIGRGVSEIANTLIPGKRLAALLLCANERTMSALPRNASRSRALLVENGVDLALWSADQVTQTTATQPPTFLFLGRLVAWKAVDILLEATAKALHSTSLRLVIIGDGEELPRLRALAKALGIESAVEFRGFVPQIECAPHVRQARALVLSSLYECGGAVVLEAMCASRPVIATNWGGPRDYLTPATGFLIEPSSREHMITAFAEKMVLLAHDASLASQMGAAGRVRVAELFDWDRKVEAMLQLYATVSAPSRGRDPRRCPPNSALPPPAL